jgi:hypothetical protein
MEAQPQSTKNTVTTDIKETNVPKTKIEGQPRPIDKETMETLKKLKDVATKQKKIINK